MSHGRPGGVRERSLRLMEKDVIFFVISPVDCCPPLNELLLHPHVVSRSRPQSSFKHNLPVFRGRRPLEDAAAPYPITFRATRLAILPASEENISSSDETHELGHVAFFHLRDDTYVGPVQ